MRLFVKLLIISTFQYAGLVSAKELQISTFGAIGDGVSDDGPAVRKAIEALVRAGPGSRLVFEKKRYRLKRFGNIDDPQIRLANVRDLRIEFAGAEMINNPWNRFIEIEKCEDVRISGFILDSFPYSFTQGLVERVDLAEGAYYARISKGYVNPFRQTNLENEVRSAGPLICWRIDPKDKSFLNSHVFLKSMAEVAGDEGLIKIVPKDKEEVGKVKIGEGWVNTLLHGGSGDNISVSESKEIHLEKYTIWGTKYGMVHRLTANTGRIYINGAKITHQPGTERMFVGTKDGFHCKDNQVGPVIENCFMKGLFDDSINISSGACWIAKDLGANQYVFTSPCNVGDSIMVLRPSTGDFSTHKVLKSEPQETPTGYNESVKFTSVVLDSPIPNVGLLVGKNTYLDGHEKLVFSGVYNWSQSGQDFIIRKNVFDENVRFPILARTSGVIEDNVIKRGAVFLANEVGYFYEGPIPFDVRIRNNRFVNRAEGISIHAVGDGAKIRNVLIENNQFSSGQIRLQSIDGLTLKDNSFKMSASSPSSPNSLISAKKFIRDLNITGNSIIDLRIDAPSVYDLSGADFGSLIMTGNREKLVQGFPNLMTVKPPVFLWLRGEKPRTFKSGEDTGGNIEVQQVEVNGKPTYAWSGHVPWKSVTGAVCFDMPLDMAVGNQISFTSSKPNHYGDGVELSILCKPTEGGDDAFKSIYKKTITQVEPTQETVLIDSKEKKVTLRFVFDCGPANDSGHDSFSIAKLLQSKAENGKK